jgi:uncharacterized protein YecT (DUF1311 family)
VKLLIALPLALGVSLAQAGEAYCDTGKEHPIDIALSSAMSKSDGSTVAIRNTLGVASGQWDKEFNRVYGDPMRVLEPPDKATLKKAQMAWLLLDSNGGSDVLSLSALANCIS